MRSAWHCRFKDDVTFHKNMAQVVWLTLVVVSKILMWQLILQVGNVDLSVLGLQWWPFPPQDCPPLPPMMDLPFSTYSFVFLICLYNLSSLLEFEHIGFSVCPAINATLERCLLQKYLWNKWVNGWMIKCMSFLVQNHDILSEK